MSEKDRCLNELRLAGLYDKDSDYEGMLGQAVERLIDIHFAEGHSGCSHQLCTQIFTRLMRGGCLTALTGKDDEWREVESHGSLAEIPIVAQNIRCSSVFKLSDGTCIAMEADTTKPITFPYWPGTDAGPKD